MANKGQYLVYWDSDVFLSLLNDYEDRAPVIRGMYGDIVDKRKGRIVTSTFSLAEVAHIEMEKKRRKRSETVDEEIKRIWLDTNVLVVEASRFIMESARELMRANLEYGGGLKGGDAVHLATAKFMETNGLLIHEINSYNDWEKYASLMNMTICKPHYDPEAVQMDLLDYVEGKDEDLQE